MKLASRFPIDHIWFLSGDTRDQVAKLSEIEILSFWAAKCFLERGPGPKF